jgi:hypothetical protein
MGHRKPATAEELQHLEDLRSGVQLSGAESRKLRESAYGFERDALSDRDDDAGSRNETAYQVRNVLDGKNE